MVHGSKSSEFMKRVIQNSDNEETTMATNPISNDSKNYFKNINELFNFKYKESKSMMDDLQNC